MALNIHIMAVTPFRQNCTLLWDDETGEAVLTDLGGDVALVCQEADKLGVRIKEIWLTHGHLDHAGGVPFWWQQADAHTPVLGPHPDDEFLLQTLPEITANYGWTPSPAFAPPTPRRSDSFHQILPGLRCLASNAKNHYSRGGSGPDFNSRQCLLFSSFLTKR